MESKLPAFTNELVKELPNVLKAVIHFGKSTRNPSQANDLDVLVLLDDTFTNTYLTTYQPIADALVQKYDTRIHLTTMLLTQYWHYAKIGDPILLNILRDGYVLYDTGVFRPLQKLLYKGQLAPTKEARWYYLLTAQSGLQDSVKHVHTAIYDIYWSITDALLACAMSEGKRLFRPIEAREYLSYLVSTKKVPSSYAQEYYRLYELVDKMHAMQIKQISGAQVDHYFLHMQQLVGALERVTQQQLPLMKN